MRLGNKTRYAILGVLLGGASTGYEIKALMRRSTDYFWRESDSTIYPMLKRLAEEGKVELAEVAHVGKKRKEIYAITEAGREEFHAWMASATGKEVRRDEWLLKLFFATEERDAQRLYREALGRAKQTLEEFEVIAERLEGLPDQPAKRIRLASLRQAMAHLELDISWYHSELA